MERPYYFKAPDQRGREYRGGRRGCLRRLPSHLSPRRPVILPRRPNRQYGRDRPTGRSQCRPAAQAPTETAAPKSATPTAIGSSNRVSNRTRPLEGQGTDQELAANHNSDVTSADSYGANDDDSEYMESRKNLPASLEKIPDLETRIEEIVEMHNDVNTVLEDFSSPREIFIQPHELEPI